MRRAWLMQRHAFEVQPDWSYPGQRPAEPPADRGHAGRLCYPEPGQSSCPEPGTCRAWNGRRNYPRCGPRPEARSEAARFSRRSRPC